MRLDLEIKETDLTDVSDVDLIRFCDKNNDSKVSKMENWVSDGAIDGIREAPQMIGFESECNFHQSMLSLR